MNLFRVCIVPDRIPCGGAGQFGPLGGLQHFTKPPVVCPNPTVRVRGWNQAGKVGGGGTVGGLPARNDKGVGCLPDGRCAAMPTHMLMLLGCLTFDTFPRIFRIVCQEQ